MKWFKSKLRKRLEFYIVMIADSIAVLEAEVAKKNLKQTLNPHEYARYSVQIGDLKSDLNLLNDILK